MRLVELFDKVVKWEWRSKPGLFHTWADFTIGPEGQYSVGFSDEVINGVRELYSKNEDAQFLLQGIDGKDKVVSVEFALKAKVSSYGDEWSEVKHGVTGTGNAYAVFSTVINIIEDYLKNNPAKYLRIVAEEPSRRKLYARMVQAMSKKNVYTFENHDNKVFLIEL